MIVVVDSVFVNLVGANGVVVVGTGASELVTIGTIMVELSSVTADSDVVPLVGTGISVVVPAPELSNEKSFIKSSLMGSVTSLP